jgi:nicotinamide-nucleotide amidase
MREKKSLVIEIVAVGSELLTPFYQDTNSLYITSRLNELGLKVSYKSIVGDDRKSLLSCFNQALKRSDMIFIIGGLGPTSDDITREVFAEALGKELEFKRELLKTIQKRFRKRGLDMAPSNRKQAFIIKGSEVIENKSGTAPGLWIEESGAVSVLLPGPPVELKTMFESGIMPRMKTFKRGFIAHKILKMTGITESKTEMLISDLYPKSPELDITVLAHPGQIEIHITSHSVASSKQAEEQIKPLIESLTERLKSYVFSENGDELEEVIGKLLVKNKKTLSIAESCTGGFLGHRITNIPGSSLYFLQGVQVYSNQAKTRLLGVDKGVIRKYGAVSSEVASSMAEGIRKRSGTDFGLAITGIAGPGGGTKEKPVGLVFTALSWDNGVKIDQNRFLGNRNTVKFRATQKAMDMLRRHILL